MNQPVSHKLFQALLWVYPRDFRREYGTQMAQLFRDCYRTEQKLGLSGISVFWLHSFSDLLVSALREHLDSFKKEFSIMTNLQRNVMALGACLAIVVIAFLLLSYGRSHEVSAILFFGKTLDALVTAGILGNLIIFLLKFTRLNPIKTAVFTMLAVNLVLLVITLLIGSRVDRTFSPASLLIAYVVSFLIWSGLHWSLSKTNPPLAMSSE
jgi:hypothetical protein